MQLALDHVRSFVRLMVVVAPLGAALGCAFDTGDVAEEEDFESSSDALIAPGQPLRLPFARVAPTARIWVAPSGKDSNPGTERAPLKSIQKGIDKAKGHPGTAILVRAGSYQGNIDLSGLRGTNDKPILLVSVDGQGAAKIVGKDGKATVNGYRVAYVGIYGFHVVSNTSEGDYGGFKLHGPWSDPARNLAIVGNTITGKGQDGFKLFNGAKNNVIVGNFIEGRWRQEGIDNVSVENTVYAWNTLRGHSEYTGITMKAGSRKLEVSHNEISMNTGTAIYIGGKGSSRFDRSFPDYWKGFEAKDVVVHHNAIEEPTRGKSATFVGANHCSLEANFLADDVGSVAHVQPGHFTYDSFDNRIVDNSVTESDFFSPDRGQSRGYVISGNTVRTTRPKAGAAAQEAKAFYAQARGVL